MKEKLYKKIITGLAIISFAVTTFAITPIEVHAGTTNPNGIQYQFDKDCKYVVSEAQEKTDIVGKTQFGAFSLEGKVTAIADKNGMQAFQVSEGKVAIKYTVNTQLPIVEDKVKKVSDATIDSNVLKGAIIVQTSNDGENWIVDKTLTDVANSESGYDSLIYETNEVQQTNGCYFRVVVAYKTEELVEESSFWLVDTSDYKTTRWAEVYKFYIVDKDQGQQTTSNTSKRKVFQDIEYRTKTNEDSGYTGKINETVDDPHYGWNLGDFIINGYTEDEEDADGTPIIYKNAGDQVTLWYSLKEDIDKLHGNEELFINEDKEGWDEYFNIPKTNFKKGTLIIRQTDADGEANDPVIFTNFLEANVRTGADTKVRLFEEGDYEVALDYEIKNTKPIIDKVTNYRVFFKFKIRNSNCMIFPFDLTTQSELRDRDISESGFRLDYAESKYLTVNVEYQAIEFNGTSYVADTRENKVATNGREYTKDGIYIITVENKTKNSRTTEKTLYVGNSPIIRALSKNNISINDINELLRQGYTINEEGGLVSNLREEPEDIEEEVRDTEEATEEAIEQTHIVSEEPDKAETESPESKIEEKASKPIAPIVVVGVCIILVLAIVVYKNKASKGTSESTINQTEIIDENDTDEKPTEEEEVK